MMDMAIVFAHVLWTVRAQRVSHLFSEVLIGQILCLLYNGLKNRILESRIVVYYTNKAESSVRKR